MGSRAAVIAWERTSSSAELGDLVADVRRVSGAFEFVVSRRGAIVTSGTAPDLLRAEKAANQAMRRAHA